MHGDEPMAKWGFALKDGISGQNLPQVRISSLQTYGEISRSCLWIEL